MVQNPNDVYSTCYMNCDKFRSNAYEPVIMHNNNNPSPNPDK